MFNKELHLVDGEKISIDENDVKKLIEYIIHDVYMLFGLTLNEFNPSTEKLKFDVDFPYYNVNVYNKNNPKRMLYIQFDNMDSDIRCELCYNYSEENYDHENEREFPIPMEINGEEYFVDLRIFAPYEYLTKRNNTLVQIEFFTENRYRDKKTHFFVQFDSPKDNSLIVIINHTTKDGDICTKDGLNKIKHVLDYNFSIINTENEYLDLKDFNFDVFPIDFFGNVVGEENIMHYRMKYGV